MSLDKTESVFFAVMDDLKDYLDDLTLVGGWMPYIYSNFLWKNFIKSPVTTVDIDFGIDHYVTRDYPKTIFETLSSLSYGERHPRMDRMFPVVLNKEKIPVEFITYPNVDINIVRKIVGEQIQINKIDKFDFILKHRVPLHIQTGKKGNVYLVTCPKPSAFLYHKGATFIDRENKTKQAKDLYYMYFILRFAPDIDIVYQEMAKYRQEGCFKNVPENLYKFFERISSEGCLMIEKENGQDEFIEDIREDIFKRFLKLREALQDD